MFRLRGLVFLLPQEIYVFEVPQVRYVYVVVLRTATQRVFDFLQFPPVVRTESVNFPRHDFPVRVGYDGFQFFDEYCVSFVFETPVRVPIAFYFPQCR